MDTCVATFQLAHSVELDMKAPTWHHMGVCVLQDAHVALSRTHTLLTPVTGSSAPVPLAGSEKTPRVSRIWYHVWLGQRAKRQE